MKTEKEINEIRESSVKSLIDATGEERSYYQGVIKTIDWILSSEKDKEVKSD